MVSASVKGGVVGGAVAGSVVIVFLVIMSPSLQLDIADTLNISCRDRAYVFLDMTEEGTPKDEEERRMKQEHYIKKVQEYQDNCSNFDLPKFQEEWKADRLRQLQEQYSQQLQEQNP